MTNLSNLPPIRQKAAQEFVNFTAQFTPPYYGNACGVVSLLGMFVKFGTQDETAKPHEPKVKPHLRLLIRQFTALFTPYHKVVSFAVRVV